MYRVGMMTETVFKFVGLKKCLKVIKDTGFECADVTLFTYGKTSSMNRYFNGDYKKKAKELKDYADLINLPLVQAHAPFPVYKENNPRYNKRMFNDLIKCIQICGILGIKNLVIHPMNNYPDDDNIKFFNRLIPYAKECGVVICTENMWNWDPSINRAKPCSCSLNESFVNIVKSVDSPYLKACVDVGHAQMFSHVNQTPRKMIEGLGEYVYCLHIHDNDGIHDNHWIPFRGIIDYQEIIEGLKNINYRNDLIVETGLPKEVSSYRDALNFYSNQYQAMKIFREMLK